MLNETNELYYLCVKTPMFSPHKISVVEIQYEDKNLFLQTREKSWSGRYELLDSCGKNILEIQSGSNGKSYVIKRDKRLLLNVVVRLLKDGFDAEGLSGRFFVENSSTSLQNRDSLHAATSEGRHLVKDVCFEILNEERKLLGSLKRVNLVEKRYSLEILTLVRDLELFFGMAIVMLDLDYAGWYYGHLYFR